MIEIKGQKIDPDYYIEKWTDWGLSTKVRSGEEIEESIHWLYGKSDLEKPSVIICRNVEDFKDSVRDSVGVSVRHSVRHSVRASVRAPVRTSVRDSVRDSVWDSVRDSVKVSVRDSVWDYVWASVRHYIRDSVRASVWDSVRDSVWDYSSPQYLADHMAFADVFVDTGVLSDKKAKELEKFKKHSEGVCMCAYGKETCVVLTSPKWSLNNDGQLHSENDFAIKWSEDSGYCFLYGVRFERGLWQKATQDKMDFEDIMAIENIDQRMAAMKMLDADELLEGANAEKIDKSERGNELYLIEDIFSQPAYFLRYECPSTGRIYLSGVEPQVAKEKQDADACMAWKHRMTKEEYKYLPNES